MQKGRVYWGEQLSGGLAKGWGGVGWGGWARVSTPGSIKSAICSLVCIQNRCADLQKGMRREVYAEWQCMLVGGGRPRGLHPAHAGGRVVVGGGGWVVRSHSAVRIPAIGRDCCALGLLHMLGLPERSGPASASPASDGKQAPSQLHAPRSHCHQGSGEPARCTGARHDGQRPHSRPSSAMRATSPNCCSEHEAYSRRCQAEACRGAG